MAELMQRQKTTFVSLSKGEIIKGKITKLTPSEILVDINAKTEAVVLEKEKKLLKNLLSTLHIGDEVIVSVLNPESDSGNPVVSLRRFMDEALWGKLKKLQESQEPLDGIIREVTKGGFVVETNTGASGFLPNSQTSFMENQQEALNKPVKVYILELNRADHKVILSQRPLLSIEDFKKKTAGIKIGEKADVVIKTITPFGLFVAIKDLSHVDGLIHISEISWERTENILDQFRTGQSLQAVVLRFDYETKRVDFSIKRANADPFEEVAKSFSIDQKVKAEVSKILSTGIALLIVSKDDSEQKIDAFIRKGKIPPTVTYEVGQSVEATVSEIDKKRRRIMLIPVLKEKPIGYR